MQDYQDILQRYSRLSDEDLLRIVCYEFDDYRPEVLEIAKAEIARRRIVVDWAGLAGHADEIRMQRAAARRREAEAQTVALASFFFWPIGLFTHLVSRLGARTRRWNPPERSTPLPTPAVQKKTPLIPSAFWVPALILLLVFVNVWCARRS